MTDTLDSQKLRQTMRLWATGVTIVTSRDGETLLGMTVSSFTSVTLEPPLILVCLQKTTITAAAILASNAFAVSMLGQGHEDVSNLFAGLTEIDGDRFDQVAHHFATTGSPIISGAMGWLDCQLHTIHDGSTHHIFMGEVVEASGKPDTFKEPLIYYDREYRKIEPR